MNEPQRIAEYNRTTFSRDEYRRLLDVAYLDFHPALHIAARFHERLAMFTRHMRSKFIYMLIQQGFITK